MKYTVKEGGKSSAPVSAAKVLRLFKEGHVSESAIVTDKHGNQITIGAFVARIDEQLAESRPSLTPRIAPPSLPQGATEEEPQAVRSPGETEDSDWEMNVVPSDETEQGGHNVFHPTEDIDADQSFDPALPPLPRSAPVETTGHRSGSDNVDSECAFPGAIVGQMTAFMEQISRNSSIGPSTFKNGMIEGVLYCVCVVLLIAVQIRSILASAEGLTPMSIGNVLFTTSLLALIAMTFHFLNTRLIQCQARFFQPEYAVVDKVFLQAFLIFQAIVVGLGIAGVVLYSLGAVMQLNAGASIRNLIWTVVFLLILFTVFYKGSSLRGLGLREDRDASPTETLLGCLTAVLRMPLLGSGWMHLAGIGTITGGILIIAWTAFGAQAPDPATITLASRLIVVGMLGVIWPTCSTVYALVVGVGIEVLRAILSIEREIRLSNANGNNAQ